MTVTGRFPIEVRRVETEAERESAFAIRRRVFGDEQGVPEDLEFAAIPGLSREIVERLSEVRPGTLGQAARIPGMTPAAVTVLGAYIEKRRAQPRV